ncbi:MAG: hypothetical protein ACI4TB_05900 [Lachnospiraceae bacterium]
MQTENIVEGYLFLNEEDAELARQDKKKIEYLEKHMDYGNVDNVLQVYKKAIVERVFKTPVGQEYLKKMQTYLLRSGLIDEEDVPPVVLYSNYSMKMRQSYSPAKQYVKPAEKKNAQWPVVSVIVNVILAIAVVAMFAITMKSDNPNILNYETNIVNKYASWEQDLTEREKVIREKEKELNISNQ